MKLALGLFLTLAIASNFGSRFFGYLAMGDLLVSGQMNNSPYTMTLSKMNTKITNNELNDKQEEQNKNLRRKRQDDSSDDVSSSDSDIPFTSNGDDKTIDDQVSYEDSDGNAAPGNAAPGNAAIGYNVFDNAPGNDEFTNAPDNDEFANAPGNDEFANSPGNAAPDYDEFANAPGNDEFANAPGNDEFANSPGNAAPDYNEFANAPDNAAPDYNEFANAPGNAAPDYDKFANAPGNAAPDHGEHAGASIIFNGSNESKDCNGEKNGNIWRTECIFDDKERNNNINRKWNGKINFTINEKNAQEVGHNMVFHLNISLIPGMQQEYLKNIYTVLTDLKKLLENAQKKEN
ncbi:conserved Plasmodium protein, unknown function [Plasmodium malariae]|uniref:Uncharacterized protein n=1 Tax=Plasmodium malariae TaxID=5858 RepID=A0A1D3JMT9_PLAMA|nr:conserved Plasmodium protein, unknown function [Plasmodium malariae]SBT87968.1 conserved Plasmodium protein, unknown function [Plasmodium malariae]